jgi:hypothetical protein
MLSLMQHSTPYKDMSSLSLVIARLRNYPPQRLFDSPDLPFGGLVQAMNHSCTEKMLRQILLRADPIPQPQIGHP